MANVHRALASLGENLGSMANYHAGLDRDRLMAMREEHFMRLSAELGEQGRAKDREAESKERALDRDVQIGGQLSQVEQAGLDRAASTAEHRETLAVQREGLGVQREGNQLQAEQLNLQNRRYDENAYLEQANRIDQRMQELNDYLTQATAEGKVMDEGSLAPLKQELTQLQEQRQTLAQERDIMLARGGDKRYRKLSKEEVAALQPKDQPPKPTQNTAAMAPQEPRGGSTIKVPNAPDKPAGMQMREERSARKLAIAGKEAAPDNARAADAARADQAGKVRESLAGKSRLDLELMLRTEVDRGTKAAIRERLAEISRGSTRDLLPSNR